ncbi:MAG: hypothetical protein AAFR93_17075, partial [Pseudomonadota bacterium]
MTTFPKPFDGAITQFFEKDAPKSVRKAIEDGDKDDILNPDHPYDREMDKDDYEDAIEASLYTAGMPEPDLLV